MRLPFALLALCVVSAPLFGQNPGRLITPDDSIPVTIVGAEQWGARFPRFSPSELSASTQYGGHSFDGSPERKCAETRGRDNVQSGDFVVGGLTTYSEKWRAGGGALTFIPAVLPAREPVLIVYAVRLNMPGLDRVYVQGQLTRETEKPLRAAYHTAFHFSSQGNWMLMATAGSNWGCFLVTIE